MLSRIAALFLALCFLHIASREALGLRCYECNSAFNPECDDPADVANMPTADCPDTNPDRQYNMCRKLTQKIGETNRVWRGCGWYGDVETQVSKGCVLRAGTFEVQVLHCTCDTDLCNGATRIGGATSLIVMIFVVLVAKVFL